MLKALLVDDEKKAMESLSQLLELYHKNILICGQYTNLSTAADAIKTHQPNLLFLDIEVGKENAFDLLARFPNPDFKVIFTTGHHEYALKAFRFSALDYLLKPIQSGLLSETIMKAESTLDQRQFRLKIESFLHNKNASPEKPKKIVLKTADSIHLVESNEIVYCEADGGYTNFHLSDKSQILVSSTLGDYEELLQDQHFFRIHQSYLLNLNYFKRYDKASGGMAVLKNGIRLPVATRKKEQLLQRLTDF